MTIIQDVRHYHAHALKTAVDKIEHPLNLSGHKLTWNTLGLIGESRELIETIEHGGGKYRNVDEIVKEMGDCYWYLTAILDSIGAFDENFVMKEYISDIMNQSNAAYELELWSLLEPERRSSLINARKLLYGAAELAEIVKKGVFHNRGYQIEKVLDVVSKSYIHLRYIADFYAILITDIMTENINRLNIIYGGKYSDEAHRIYQESKVAK